MYIYGLIDPRTGMLRYIGQTADPGHRHRHHRSRQPKRDRSSRSNWIRALRQRRQKPKMVVLEQTDFANEAEQWWIAWFRAIGQDLVNGPSLRNAAQRR